MTAVRIPSPGTRQLPGARSLFASLLAVLLAAAAVVIGVPATPAHAASNGQWSFDPTVPDGTSQNARRYFFLEGDPGTSLQDSATLANSSDHAITFKVFGSDAKNDPKDGAFALNRIIDPNTDLGLWIKVPDAQQQITLQPGQRVTVPFTVDIPPNAMPGDHVGGIVALNNAVEGQQQQGPIKIDIQRQIGARIYLRVRGQILPAVSVENVHVTRNTGFGAFFGSGDATIHYTLVNRGNVIIRPNLELTATGLFGRTLMHRGKTPLNIELMPGNSITLTQQWHGAPRLDNVSLKVKVTDTGNNVSASKSTGWFALPWPALLILALLLLVGGGLWAFLRHNKGKGRGEDGTDPKPSGPDAPSGKALKEPADATASTSPAAPAKKPKRVAPPAKVPAGRKPEPAPVKPAETPTVPAQKPETAPAEAATSETAKSETAKDDSADDTKVVDAVTPGSAEPDGKPDTIADPAGVGS